MIVYREGGVQVMHLLSLFIAIGIVTQPASFVGRKVDSEMGSICLQRCFRGRRLAVLAPGPIHEHFYFAAQRPVISLGGAVTSGITFSAANYLTSNCDEHRIDASST